MTPIFTILIATYNAASLLSPTLNSLAVQTCRDFNVIIQDGASSDDTATIVHAFKNKLPNILLHSEKDVGIYDAWNKALDRWQKELGEWVLFLGAGDTLYDCDVLNKVRKHLLLANEQILFAGGSIQLVTPDGNHDSMVSYRIESINATWRMVPHNAVFHRKSLFKVATFDKSMKIAGDYEFFCRNWTPENGNLYLPYIITLMLRGGVSDSPESVLRLRWEYARIKYRYFKLTDFWWTTSIKLLKGLIIFLLCTVFGKKTGAVLDTILKIRGLPPVWEKSGKS